MLKNRRLRHFALLVSLMLLLTSTVNTTFGLIVTKTDSLINTFTPFREIVNNLILRKTVEHPLGEDYVIPDDISFDFRVSFGSSYADAEIETSLGTLTADESGTIIVSVKPGAAVDVEGIEVGTKVTVTELLRDGSGFSVKDGVVTKEMIVPEDGTLTIDFVNLYTPAAVQPLNVTVEGTKILEGREWQDGDTFSFVLEQYIAEDTWVALGTETISYDPENAQFNAFDFSDILQKVTFDRVGTYAFRLTETVGSLEDMTYDPTVNTFTVKVTDVDMDGKLEIGDVVGRQNVEVVRSGDAFVASVTFNNIYLPSAIPDPEEIAVTITVRKTVKNSGETILGPDGFEFVLTDVTSGEKRALLSDENGEAVFTLPFTVTDVGKSYTYQLRETDGGRIGVTYDTTVHTVQISIALGGDNTLIPTVVLNGETVEACVVEFENLYAVEEPVAPPTADGSHTTFWLIMMFVSGSAFLLLLLAERRYRKGAKR